MNEVADYVIVGGGIWGASTAFHLAQQVDRNARIVWLERNAQLSDETTRQSAGQVGQLRADPLLARAVGYTLDLLGRFPAETGLDPHFVRSGSIHLALNPDRAAMFDQLAAAARSLQIQCEPIGVDDLPNRLPHFLTDQVHAALWVPQDGYVDATRCALAFAQAAQRNGVELRLNANVEQLTALRSTIRIRTGSSTIESPRVVLTGGPWTGRLCQQLGFSAPMHPIRLQQARSRPAGVAESHPVVRVPDESCYIRPEKGGFLYGFFDPEPLPISLHEPMNELRTADVEPEPALVQESQRRLHRVLPLLSEIEIDEYRQGMMTCTPDGRFVLGPIPGLSDRSGPFVGLATGCGGTGIAASAAVGRWLADWMAHGEPRDDLTPYAPERFGERADDIGWLRDQARETSAAYYRLTPASHS